MRRSLEWLAPGLGLKRWVLLAFAGGVLLVYAVLFCIGVLWSPQLMGGLGMGWLHNRHWAALLLSVDGMAVGLFALPTARAASGSSRRRRRSRRGRSARPAVWRAGRASSRSAEATASPPCCAASSPTPATSPPS